MGAWDTILKYGGKAMKGMGKAANATGKSAGHAVLHPSQTLRGAGQAVKMATTGAAVGYVGWEKLTTDKSVARIVSEAVVGKSATDALAGTTEDMKELNDIAGETVSAIGEAVGGADSKLNGVSNFLREASGGGLFNMLSGFLRNLGGGNVSGLNIAGLIGEKYIGSDENWEKAERAIIEACEEKGLKAKIEYGEAAFYGPKLDFMVKDAIGHHLHLRCRAEEYREESCGAG